MEVTLKGESKEIAALVLAVQGRQKLDVAGNLKFFSISRGRFCKTRDIEFFKYKDRQIVCSLLVICHKITPSLRQNSTTSAGRGQG